MSSKELSVFSHIYIDFLVPVSSNTKFFSAIYTPKILRFLNFTP